MLFFCIFFFFNDTATTEIYTLSLHDALPILEEDVARLHDRALQVDRAVAALLPVPERLRAQLELAGTVGRLARRERALLQAGRRDEDLEDGGRRVLALDRPVHEREVRVLDHAQPRAPIDRLREAVDVEGGRRDHRQEIAVAWIHHDDRARVPLHRPFRGLLNATVHGGD